MRNKILRRLESALRAANRGLPVIPLNWVEDGECSCGRQECSNAGKHPLTSHGLADATLDSGIIRQWWNKWPSANIGVATGAQTGLVVLDIDPRHGGQETMTLL